MSLHQDFQSRPKLFIQMAGAPGSGKSTMARLLGQSIGGLVIDHDVIRSALLDDNDAPFYETAKRAYHLQWALARDVMKQGLSVIIDSTCNHQETLDNGSALAEEHGFSYWHVECRVGDVDVLDKRLRARVPMKSQRTGVDLPPVAAGGSAGAGSEARLHFETRMMAQCRPEKNYIIEDMTGRPEDHRDRVLQHIVAQIEKRPAIDE